MTEAEWLACEEPSTLLSKWRRFPERKLVLFGCACCRLWWHLFTEELCQVVEAAEKRADAVIGPDELAATRRSLESRCPNLFWYQGDPELTVHWVAWLTAIDERGAREFEYQHPLGSDTFDDMLAALKDDLAICLAVAAKSADAEYELERAAQAGLLRDIFGNPFRPVTFSPSWRTDTAVSLAAQMYESRDFSAMPILADALQDAGCDNEDILNHCRDANQPHVRGCWVVDLVLGKE